MYIVVFLQRWDDLSHTHSGLQVDGVSAKNLALIALLFAVLQHHHALEVPPTAVYYCNIIGGGVGMFGGAKPDWLFSIVFYLTHNPPRYKNEWRGIISFSSPEFVLALFQLVMLIVGWIFHQEYVGCCIFDHFLVWQWWCLRAFLPHMSSMLCSISPSAPSWLYQPLIPPSKSIPTVID